MFETSITEIIKQVDNIEPTQYARTRNFTGGAVTRLSPYISRGVISTKFILDKIAERGCQPYQIQKLVQELAWRDYFQRVWQAKGNEIDDDLKHPQTDVENSLMPRALIDATTGIEAVDDGIDGLYETGYAHNHLRLYISSIACNIAKSHWRTPARWMYFHLFDADWASNALSWQWTAGAFSHKKYFASQENINKYCETSQRGTFLDVDYREFQDFPVPEVLQAIENPDLTTELPKKEAIKIDSALPTCVYNFYNLDPFWHSDTPANRVLLFEPSHFEKYPVSAKTIEFVLKLAENISGIQIYTGEFGELANEYNLSEVHFKEHPTAAHYKGHETPRDWMFPELEGYFPSFFNYWKKCEKLLKAKNKR